MTEQVEERAERPSYLADLGREALGAVYKGAGSAVRGLGEAARAVGDVTTTPIINALLDTNYRTPNLAEGAADALRDYGQSIQAGVSEQTQEAMRASTPSGDLTKPDTWSMGDDPSLEGYLALGMDVLGQQFPVLLASWASGGLGAGGRLAATATAGGAQGGGAAVEQAEQVIDDLDKGGQLEAESSLYRDLLEAGESHESALSQVKSTAGQMAFLLTTPISALGGALTGKIVNPAEQLIGAQGLAGRMAGRAALGAVEEGAQEAAEGIQANRGANVGAGMDMETTGDSFGDAVMGALAGAKMGTAAGALEGQHRAVRPRAEDAVGPQASAEPLGNAAEVPQPSEVAPMPAGVEPAGGVLLGEESPAAAPDRAAPSSVAVETAQASNPEATAISPMREEASRMADSEEDAATPVRSIDERAHDAATSPLNDLPEPTDAQKGAGNYKVGRTRVAGLDISIENPEGSERRGTSPDGTAWANRMAGHYGYIRRTEGADGDQVDVFVRPGTAPDFSGPIFVIDQVDPARGGFDEAKVMLGYDTRDDAERAYRASYSPDWRGMGKVTQMDVPTFKRWLAEGDTTRPATDSGHGVLVSEPDITAKGGKPFLTRGAAQRAAAAHGGASVVAVDGGFVARPGFGSPMSPLGVLERRGGSRASGIDSKVASGQAEAFMRRFPGATGLRVSVVDRVDQIPENSKPSAQAEGAYYPASDGGRIYLVAENLPSGQRLQQVLAHEVVGHFGVEALLGERFRDVLADVRRLARAPDGAHIPRDAGPEHLHYATFEAVTMRYPDYSAENRAREVLARIAEQGKRPVFLESLYGKIRAALRRLGLNLKLTNADIKQMVIDAGRFLQRAPAARVSAGMQEAAASMAASEGRREGATVSAPDSNSGAVRPPEPQRQGSVSESRRGAEPVDLPPTVIGQRLGAAGKHPDHAAAKAGDTTAAYRLLKDVLSREAVDQVRAAIGKKKPTIVPVLAVEAVGHNKIPAATAAILGESLGLPVDNAIYQSVKAKRTALDGLGRIFQQPEFEGEVQPGKSYFLVDDTLTQGGTLAALASHIRQNGGRVLGSFALTGKMYSATLRLSPETLSELRVRYGDVEQAFREGTGRGFDALTESEGRYLARHDSPDAVRSRILAERHARVDGHGARPDENRSPEVLTPERPDEAPPRAGLPTSGPKTVRGKRKP
ncbi:hypothetical protein ACOTEY_28990 [Achromobacter xylosoxidans]